MIKIGDYNKLTCVRKSDLGYMLQDKDKNEVLLHFKQADHELKENEEVNVFIYSDKCKRPTATMQQPLVTVENAGFVKVVEIVTDAGVFVSINTPKDIFISKDYLPYDRECWPQVDDTLLIRLKIKADILDGKPLNRFDIISQRGNVDYAERERVSAYVCRNMEKGLGLVTKDMEYVFVPENQLRGKYRLGQEVEVYITKALGDEYYGKLNQDKEVLVDSDMELILKYLDDHHGLMKLTAKSSAEDVEKILHISRKAFKRAYGGLYKQHLIDFDETKTFKVRKPLPDSLTNTNE